MRFGLSVWKSLEALTFNKTQVREKFCQSQAVVVEGEGIQIQKQRFL